MAKTNHEYGKIDDVADPEKNYYNRCVEKLRLLYVKV